MKKECYLLFTSHDSDEIDAKIISKKIYDKLKKTKNNDEALEIINKYDDEIIGTINSYFAQAPGEYNWPFNNYKILGTYYLQVY